MNYLQLAYLHLATVLPAFAIGTFMLVRRKGTPGHRLLGRVYLVLMLVTAIIALCMPARVGPTVFGRFGFIHLLCLLVIYSAPKAYFAARRHDVATHRASMISMYIGALIIAGLLAFSPGRLLHRWLFGTSTTESGLRQG